MNIADIKTILTNGNTNLKEIKNNADYLRAKNIENNCDMQSDDFINGGKV